MSVIGELETLADHEDLVDEFFEIVKAQHDY